MEGKCPNCGWFEEFPTEEDDQTAWAYTRTTYEDRWDALKKLNIRTIHEEKMKDALEVYDEEDLGSCITGTWKENNEN
jgi:hypothetical protein